MHWRDRCWSWNSSPLASWCEELTYLKRFWCWDWLKAGGEGDDRGWNGWMASPIQWAWVSVNSGSWWWTGRPGVLQSMGSRRVRHNWITGLNWTELNWIYIGWINIRVVVYSTKNIFKSCDKLLWKRIRVRSYIRIPESFCYTTD